MSCTIRTADEKRALLAEWRASGQSRSRFAHQRGISKNSILNWLRREDALEQKEPTRFVDVEIVEPQPVVASRFVVHIAGTGHRVDVPPSFDAAELRRVVAALC